MTLSPETSVVVGVVVVVLTVVVGFDDWWSSVSGGEIPPVSVKTIDPTVIGEVANIPSPPIVEVLISNKGAKDAIE